MVKNGIIYHKKVYIKECDLIVTDVLLILWSLYTVGMGGNYSKQIRKRIFLNYVDFMMAITCIIFFLHTFY